MRRNVKQMEHRSSSSWRGRFLFLLIALAAVQLVLHRSYYENELQNIVGGKKTIQQSAQINETVFRIVSEYGIEESWIKRENERWIIEIPKDLSITRIYTDIVRETSKLGAEIKTGEEDVISGNVELILTYKNRTVLQLRLKKGEGIGHVVGYVALILDDFGYVKGKLLQRALGLPYDLTFAVIPGLQYSEEIAQEAHDMGKEVIVHLPMEALEEKVEDNGYTIYVNQSKGEMRERMRKAVRSVPHSVGLNNHQGSRATADETVMSVLMNELAASGYYFIDSRTTAKSVAVRLSVRAKVPSASNDLFFDVNADTGSVRQQMERIEENARRNNKTIAIGHFREVTIAVLEEALPKLEKRGVRFVKVSELLEK